MKMTIPRSVRASVRSALSDPKLGDMQLGFNCMGLAVPRPPSVIGLADVQVEHLKIERPLRPYQADWVTGTHAQLREYRSTLGIGATGSGKTTFFAHLANHWPERDYAKDLSDRVLVIAHGDELLRQARDRIAEETGENVGLEKAEARAGLERIVVASINTLYSEDRLHHWKPDSFGIVIYDECHHAVSPMNKAIIDYFSGAKVLGVTATPDRADEKAMGMVFESEHPAFVYEIDDAIDDGWLVPIHILPLHLQELDLSKAKGRDDFTKEDLEDAMTEEVIAHMVKATLAESGDMLTLLFTTSVDNATRQAELINLHKPGSARTVNHHTPADERRGIISAFKRAEFQYLPNVGIATEGFDCELARCLAQGRPTKSRSLHAQIVGRVLRPIFPPGFDPNTATAAERREAIAASPKPFALILEFTGNSGKHDLVCSVDILGGKYDEEVVTLAKKRVRASAGMDAGDALAQAKAEIAQMRNEAARKLLLQSKANYTKGNQFNPFEVLHVSPSKEDAWSERFGGSVATEKQVDYLRKCGVAIPANLTKQQAHHLIGSLIKRRDLNLATYKQVARLGQYGIQALNISFDKASQLMTAIAENGWSAPPAHVVDSILTSRQYGNERSRRQIGESP
jgi:superfamily II DNA or RNA helicase